MLVPEDPVETITKKIYSFKLDGATEISSLGLFNVGGVQKSVDQMTEAELAAGGRRSGQEDVARGSAVGGLRVASRRSKAWPSSNDGQLALINDNDFGVAGIVIDNATGTFTIAPGYNPEKPTLGMLKVPGLDASDRDSAINIRSWPVFGMYEPDAIASFTDRQDDLPGHRQRRRRARLAGLRRRSARELADAGPDGVPECRRR